MATLAVLLASLGLCARLIHTANAESTKTVFNPFTGKLDFITALNTTNFVGGAGITITCSGGTCTFTNSSGTSSTLAISSGSANNSVIVSSPTSNVVFDSAPFNVSLQGTTTSFITIPHRLTQAVLISSWTGAFETTSTSYVSVSSSSLIIVPTSTSSCISIWASGPIENKAVGKNCYVTVFQGSTNIAQTAGGAFSEQFINSGGVINILSYSFSVSTCPATTSALTYTTQFKVDSAGDCVLGGGATENETLTLMNYQ